MKSKLLLLVSLLILVSSVSACSFKNNETKEVQEVGDSSAQITKKCNVGKVLFEYPGTWGECAKTENGVSFRTDYDAYQVDLVLSLNVVTKEKYGNRERPANVNELTNGNGEFFEEAQGGTLMGGLIRLNDNYYRFDFSITSSQPAPEELDGIWAPDHDVSKDILLSILRSAKLNYKYSEVINIPEEGLRDGGIYRNDEYKFEFKYPKNVILTSKDLSTDELPILKVSILKDYSLETKVAEDKAYDEIVSKENEKKADIYKENNFMPSMEQGGELTDINGNIFYSKKIVGEGIFGVIRYSYIQIGTDVLVLGYSADNDYFEKALLKHSKDNSWSYDSERVSLNNEFDNIIKSFKFINN